MAGRLRSITLDEASLSGRSEEFAHEVTVAINDLLAGHQFAPVGLDEEVFDVRLKTEEQRLVFLITPGDSNHTLRMAVTIQPLKRLIRDYFIVCESYFEALRSSNTRKLEAIDMGRRGLHNEAAETLQEILKGKIEVDFCTARRLFTLIAVLHL